MTIQLVAITSINSNAEIALEKYLSVVGPLMQSASAKIVCRYELGDCVVGDGDVQYVSVIEYPDEASVKSVFESAEYKALEDVKKLAFSEYQVSKAVTHR